MKNGVFLVIDRSNCRCGLTDRLKTAVGLYHLAREKGVGFRFIHRAGFDIRDYLAPNEVDWSAEPSDLSPLPWKRRRLDYLPPFEGMPGLQPDRQYVCRRFIGKNLLEMTGVPDWEKVWREAFRSLFTPGRLVRDELERTPMPPRYAVVNARFVNSLGHFEEADCNAPLPPDEQKRLIEAVLAETARCQERSDVPVIVYSDSVRFLEAASERGFRTCDPAGIGHIMDPDVSDRVKLMTFVNFYHMAGAEAIYSILNLEGFPSGCLYKTQYPRYAAILGGKPFIRI